MNVFCNLDDFGPALVLVALKFFPDERVHLLSGMVFNKSQKQKHAKTGRSLS
jgi:hypothetical protein